MTLSIRQQIDNAATGTGAISLTLSSAQVGDTVVIIHVDNFHTLADLTTPTGTAVSSWGTVKHSLDGGTNDSHAKVWMGTVSTAGGTAVEGTNNTDHERYFGAWVYVGSVDFDEAASTDSDTTSTSHVAPAVTADTADAWLICHWSNLGNVENYTIPGGMTARTEYDLGTFCTYRAADEQISASGSTGTRTATVVAVHEWAAVSVLVKSGAVPPAAPDLFVVRSNLSLR